MSRLWGRVNILVTRQYPPRHKHRLCRCAGVKIPCPGTRRVPCSSSAHLGHEASDVSASGLAKVLHSAPRVAPAVAKLSTPAESLFAPLRFGLRPWHNGTTGVSLLAAALSPSPCKVSQDLHNIDQVAPASRLRVWASTLLRPVRPGAQVSGHRTPAACTAVIHSTPTSGRTSI